MNRYQSATSIFVCVCLSKPIFRKIDRFVLITKDEAFPPAIRRHLVWFVLLHLSVRDGSYVSKFFVCREDRGRGSDR